MKKLKQALFLISSFCLLLSCIKSNALKQDAAERTIRTFLSNNTFESPRETIRLQAIQKIGHTDIFSEAGTSVKVFFKDKEDRDFALTFIFIRGRANKWSLESVEATEEVSESLAGWLRTKDNLDIPVQE